MKNALGLICLLLSTFALQAQNRNATVKALNNYVLYANANAQALTATLTSLERYDGLFHDCLKGNRPLGGEAYEKPKPSPYVDTDMFTMGEDDPAHLYKVALQGAGNLPTTVKTDLNKSAKALSESSLHIMVLIDSMSDLFSAPPMAVTADSTALPYRLLYAARHTLQLAKFHRDALFLGLENAYAKSCPLTAPAGEYIYSIEPLTEGMRLCQSIVTGFCHDDLRSMQHDLQALDSLRVFLESAELKLLKGIAPIGNSKQFPNKGNFDGFDLYNKYEDICAHFKAISRIAQQYFEPVNDNQLGESNAYRQHQASLGQFNGNQGLIYEYNEFVLLIGGGKMKLVSDGAGSAKYIYKGWSNGSKTLPLRSILLWMQDIPRFEVRAW